MAHPAHGIAGHRQSCSEGLAALILVAGLYALHIVGRAWALYACLTDEKTSFREILRVQLAGEAIEMLTFTGPLLAGAGEGISVEASRAPTPSHSLRRGRDRYLLYTFVSAVHGGRGTFLSSSETIGYRRVLHRPTTALIVGMGRIHPRRASCGAHGRWPYSFGYSEPVGRVSWPRGGPVRSLASSTGRTCRW